MSRRVKIASGAALVLGAMAWLAGKPALAQQATPEAPFADSGEIDGDLAGRPPPAQSAPRYAPGVWEAYERQMAAYRQKLAAAEAEQRLREQAFAKQQEIYRRELAASQAAMRRYRKDRAAYESQMARFRQ